ncbi:restless-like transposase [Hirsutella rhossiliensis]|uniref:Restless-like transposase n=1 Tax=Hirsutella rhossiliensis TaxID=111463 RepID=A0A9P8MLJ5_9HYPO|nr:restless-like transposase [Hirsutella rhossiliensis]KAH0957202.1 restless-like transposase [Hirsutella rhossiliensis]
MAAPSPAFAPISPDDHRGLLWIAAILSLIFVLLTFSARLYVRKRMLGRDDYASIAAVVLGVAQYAAVFAGMSLGLGSSEALVGEGTGRIFLASEALFICVLYMAKFAVLLATERLLAGKMKTVRRLCIVIRVVVGLGASASLLAISVGCSAGSLLVPQSYEGCDGQVWRWTAVSLVDGGRRLPKGSTTNKRSIAQFFNLDANDQKEQAFINKLKNQFDKDVFQSLLLAWITESNVAFRAVEAPRFRRLLEYLNPSIALTQAHMTHSTIRTKLFQEYHQYKHIVIKELRERPGQIHLAFDGWRSPNRYALNGIAAFYLSKEKRPQKIILGLPELRESHTGENIASQVAEVIESFEIQDKIGKQRRVRCFGHIINLVAKALLFGKDNEVFKSEERLDLDLARHDLWRKRGPIGKLHNLVHWIHQSDRLTYMLRDLQRKRDMISHFRNILKHFENAIKALEEMPRFGKLKLTLIILLGLRFICPVFMGTHTSAVSSFLSSSDPAVRVVSPLVWQQIALGVSILEWA